MSSIFSLFDILTIIYLFRSVQLGLKVWREWAQIRIEPFTAAKKHLADQASYFIAVPIGVLAHEFGHVLAVWASGGQVAEFHYRAFWGYVVPIGSFTAAQSWFIAIAGTLASLLFGLLVWLFFRRASSSTLRYFGLRAFRFQVYFSLIYYPLFTLIGFDGDWRTIYDFTATPILSLSTAVIHAGFLLLFWRGDRSGWFEAPSHETIAEQDRFEQVAMAAAASPHDAQLQIQYIDGLRRGGAKRKAEHHLEIFLAQNGDSAAGYLELAALSNAGKRQVPKKARDSAEKALSLGLSEPRQAAYAHELIGRYELEAGQVEAAINNFTEALANLPKNDKSKVQLHLLRSQALRRQQRYEQAYQDILEVISYAQRSGNDATLALAQQELETLESHAGHTFGATYMKTP
jgi:tetratricopeptide (TPR) repeat protein